MLDVQNTCTPEKRSQEYGPRMNCGLRAFIRISQGILQIYVCIVTIFVSWGLGYSAYPPDPSGDFGQWTTYPLAIPRNDCGYGGRE